MIKLHMRIHIGSDHAGLEFKNELIEHLVAGGHDVTDHGPYQFDALDDYPDFCIPAAEAVSKDPASLGIVLGGSGNGEQIAANKVKGVRAALVWSVETAKLAREHNNANVIAVGQRQHSAQEVKSFIDAFIATPFPGDERHARRIAKIAAYEN
jgi:ribose 5-phosphate isomerase B